MAQFESKQIKNPNADRTDYSKMVHTERIKAQVNSPAASVAPVDYSGLVNINFLAAEEARFRYLKGHKDNGHIWLLGFTNTLKSAPVLTRARNWLNQAQQFLELDSTRITFRSQEIISDENGESHARFRQLYDGIPVYGAELILHSRDGRFHLMNGRVVSDNRFVSAFEPVIETDEVKATIRNDLPDFREDALSTGEMKIDIEVEQWREELVYYPVSVSDYKLAYHVIVYPNQANRFEYFIDASSGKIVDSFRNICALTHKHNINCTEPNDSQPKIQDDSESNRKRLETFLDGPSTANAEDLSGIDRLINTYEAGNAFYLIDASREMYNPGASTIPNDPFGVIWTIDLNNTSPVNDNSLYTHVNSFDNTWRDSPQGVSAHFNAGMAYDYFRNTFGRNSISGTGQNIVSFINVTDPDENSLGNAFWNGIGIYYGNGDAFFEPLGRGLDVAGHEMSHGVIENTANLEYRNESGAINEAYADIFGAMIDREDWQIGEDVVKLSAFPSGALRDMADPHNGAAMGDFGRGWQPKHYDERYIGAEDNGGVHINSGIVNHAFYLFAQAESRETAEQVFYRALNVYLTRSSDFKELRFAVVQSAADLYGNATANSARDAFDAVGIIDENMIEEEEDFETNPGLDLLLVSDSDLENLYLFNIETGESIFNPLSSVPLLSKPSITDDGSQIVFVGTDNHVHLIALDWSTDPPLVEEAIITQSPDWRNVVISKNGRFLALLENIESNEIVVFDLETSDFNVFDLYNPTYSNGISTGEVVFADVMEFDASSTSIMYDAFNRVQGNTGEIEFWDIGFIEVWNPDFDTWALGTIDKLFSNLPEGINIGNPTFSKNSAFIIAFDIFEGNEYEILGLNLESQTLNSIIPNAGLSYPSFSRDDQFLIYDFELFGYTDLGILQLQEDKISRVTNSDQILLPGGKWGVWFSNGERQLTDLEEVSAQEDEWRILPNPVSEYLRIDAPAWVGSSTTVKVEIVNAEGKRIHTGKTDALDLSGYEVNVSTWPSGTYHVFLDNGVSSSSKTFIINAR